MDKTNLFKFSQIVLVGFGGEGQATLKWLRKSNFPGRIFIVDEGQITEDILLEILLEIGYKEQETGEKLQIFTGDKSNQFLTKVDSNTILIRSAGFSISKPILTQAREKGAQITTATNIFLANFPGRVIGVTGSKGKSTTASLLATMLQEGGLEIELVGNIGRPMLEIINSRAEIAVAELSSYQLSDLRYSPEIVIITNLFAEHLDWHDGQEKYFIAKMNIIKEAKQIFYLQDFKNIIDKYPTTAQKIEISSNLEFNLDKFKLHGDHNIANAALVIACTQKIGITREQIQESISKFQPLRHRLENIGKFRGINFIDDANAAIPEATIAALQAFSDQQIDVLFLGGSDRGVDFGKLALEIIQRQIPYLVLFPESGARIWREILQKDEEGNYQPEKLKTGSMREAVQWAYKKAAPESFVLLSCASPSYSLWHSFEEKGEEFQKEVKRLDV